MIKQKDSLDIHLEKWLKHPEFRKEWEASETQYQLVRQIIGERIKKGLSQRDLAKKAKTTQAVISRVESMNVNPSIQLIDKIAKALGKTVQIKLV